MIELSKAHLLEGESYLFGSASEDDGASLSFGFFSCALEDEEPLVSDLLLFKGTAFTEVFLIHVWKVASDYDHGTLGYFERSL